MYFNILQLPDFSFTAPWGATATSLRSTDLDYCYFCKKSIEFH
jgi:hypothetical protein